MFEMKSSWRQCEVSWVLLFFFIAVYWMSMWTIKVEHYSMKLNHSMPPSYMSSVRLNPQNQFSSVSLTQWQLIRRNWPLWLRRQSGTDINHHISYAIGLVIYLTTEFLKTFRPFQEHSSRLKIKVVGCLQCSFIKEFYWGDCCIN